MNSEPIRALLPKPAVARAYGEPWRADAGWVVTDESMAVRRMGSGDVDERAYYGGTLVAESMDRGHARRAADCVNFCAGVEFRDGFAYVGGLADLLDLLEQAHAEMRDPFLPTTDDNERDYFHRWSTMERVLKNFGRDSWARKKCEQESA